MSLLANFEIQRKGEIVTGVIKADSNMNLFYAVLISQFDSRSDLYMSIDCNRIRRDGPLLDAPLNAATSHEFRLVVLQ